MKKLFLILLVIGVCFGVAGCGVDSETYTSTLAQLENLNAKNDELTKTIAEKDETISTFSQSVRDKDFEILLLTKQNESLQINLNASNEKRESLEDEMNQLKNGAPSLLSEIKTYFERGDHLSVLSTAKKLHDKFNGYPEDIEGQALAEQSEIKVKEAEEAEEAARIAAEKDALKTAQDKVREIIAINSVRPSKPNSADGVDLYIDWTNSSDKSIKYVTFVVSAINAVGDEVYCKIRGSQNDNPLSTGPFEPKTKNKNYWECVWYNNTVAKVRIDEIEIDYIDDESISINGEEFNYEW